MSVGFQRFELASSTSTNENPSSELGTRSGPVSSNLSEFSDGERSFERLGSDSPPIAPYSASPVIIRTPPEQLENLGLQETLQIAQAHSSPTDVDAYGCWLGASVLPFSIAPTGDVYVLLGKEREDQTWKCGSNRWSDFGGRRCTEKDRDCAETAGREFWEESCCVVNDATTWFGTYFSEQGRTPTDTASGKLAPMNPRAPLSGASQHFAVQVRRPATKQVVVPTKGDPKEDLASLFRRGGYTYRLVRTGNVRPLPQTGLAEAEPVSTNATKNSESVSESGVACPLVESDTKPAAIVGKSYVTFACRVPWDPTLSERFHNTVGWLGCLYDAIRLFHMAYYDLFVLPEEAKPVNYASSSFKPSSEFVSGETPLPSRRASVVNFSSSGLTAAESLGSMPRLTLGMILPYMREAKPTIAIGPAPRWNQLPKSANLVDVGWNSNTRVAWVDYRVEGKFALSSSGPIGNPWSVHQRQASAAPGINHERIEFWVPPDALVLSDVILALRELVGRRERVKALYRMVPANLATHPSVSTETSVGGDLYSVVVKTEYLEKQAVQWWSLPRLTEMMANNGVYRTEQTRSSCNEMLSVVCQLLAHDFPTNKQHSKRNSTYSSSSSSSTHYHSASHFSSNGVANTNWDSRTSYSSQAPSKFDSYNKRPRHSQYDHYNQYTRHSRFDS